ncbi:hypothetical protein EPI10_032482 [Gossypium australe]|uniref:Uncharacterized protein n=1 Tax=Gossypium australe TaxID=47621 RepID=A0A5B6X6I2_9ROSI|nr:hypothetical protein EPI10_032482 [Gossypium australe]
MRGGLLDCSIQRDKERQGKERSDNCRSGEGRAMALNVLLERQCEWSPVKQVDGLHQDIAKDAILGDLAEDEA